MATKPNTTKRFAVEVLIEDVETLKQEVQRLQDLYYDMETTNVRIRPISPWTKARWMEQLNIALNFFKLFLPKSDEKIQQITQP